MAAKKGAKKATKKAGRRRPRGVTLEPTALAPTELAIREPDAALRSLEEAVRSDGGAVLAAYREPLGAHALLLVALPIDKVRPTPFQRDVSDAHVKKLVRAMDKTRRFLDPLILVRGEDGYFTPNGNHRLSALRELEARSVVGLLVPEFSVAYQILALNIEKAHSLRERALEVQRMYRELAHGDAGKESALELEFEEPALVTLGFAYAERPRLAGGAYHPVLRKVDTWIDEPLARATPVRARRAELLIELDTAVSDTVEALKARGLKSPYLKNFVVARVNPLRFMKGELPGCDELLQTMTRKARSLNVERISPADLASVGGAPEEE
ncbi:MAG: chromosome partitioning protein ParB [Pseudomonadota bacterium]